MRAQPPLPHSRGSAFQSLAAPPRGMPGSSEMCTKRTRELLSSLDLEALGWELSMVGTI
jgi:hypothetical protein